MKKQIKIEDVSDKDIGDIIQSAMEKKMPKLRLMPYLGGDEVVIYEYPELVACCPMTGIMDLYTVTITFNPLDYIPELKSLKFYMLAYKDMRIGHEHLCSKIKGDFEEQVKPEQLSVRLDVAVRGGFKTTIYNESE